MTRKLRFCRPKQKGEEAKRKPGRPVKKKRGPKKKTLDNQANSISEESSIETVGLQPASPSSDSQQSAASTANLLSPQQVVLPCQTSRQNTCDPQISHVENASSPGFETPTLRIRPLITSSPKVTVSVQRVPSPRAVFEKSFASPIRNLTPVLSDTTSHSPPIILKQAVQSSAPGSSRILVRRMESETPSGGESPLHVRQSKTSTSKVAITLQSPVPPNQTVDECTMQADVVESLLDSDRVDDLERSTADFDPEAEEIFFEHFRVGRPSLWEESTAHRGSETVPFPDDNNTLLRFEDKDLTEALSVELRSRVPPGWRFYFGEGRVYVVLMTPNPLRYLPQRVVHAAFSGGIITVQVHLETLSEEHEIYRHTLMKPIVPLTPASIRNFAIVLCKAVVAVQMHKICIGVNIPQFVDESHKHPHCFLDTNKFEETGYDKTLRTKNCSYLISRYCKRCPNCVLYLDALKKREKRRLPDDVVNPKTRHNILTPTRLKQKLRDKEKTIRSQQAKLVRLRANMKKMLDKESVPVDDELSAELSKSFENAPDFVRIFWEEQQRAHTVKKASGMKWHPLLIRWALYIKTLSSTAYSAVRESGFLKLPSERTLYEYSHANPATEGMQHNVIKRLAEAVLKSPSMFYTFFVLMFDEMYVFQNIVYDKGTGEIVGYANLNSVEEEIRKLENNLEENREADSAPVAKTMLTYLAKCVGSSVNGVVACFPTAVLSKEVLHSRTWDVIEELEMAGVKVIALIADGHATNGAFFNMHKPITLLNSGVVFDTLNIFALDRPLFFFTDLPHLLKTIRNCFANSGAHKNTRMLMKNSEIITWKTIIACYKSEHKDTLKFCHKLTPQSVFLTSYSVMKVSLAASVMSKTVALYIRDVLQLNRPETVRFILFVNDWFDCMNGKYYRQEVREKNPNLAAYVNENDQRFDFMNSFLSYLDEWKKEVASLNISETDKQKRMLSPQTLLGIKRTTRAFQGVTKYLLTKRRELPDRRKEGYILPRTFQQDRAEHYFSRQRAMGGGSSHPSISQFLQNQNSMEVHGNLGMKRRRGNTEAVADSIDVNAPVPKRKKVNRKLHVDDDSD